MPDSPDWIDLASADDVRDVVHRAVARLAQGGVVGLPTEATYVLAASAVDPEAVARLAAINPDGVPGSISLALRGAEELPDWLTEASPTARRLARRVWPGPVTFRSEDGVADGLVSRLPGSIRKLIEPNGARLDSPAHDLTRAIVRLVSGLLAFVDPSRDGQPPAYAARQLATLSGLDLVLDDGPTLLGEPSTVVRLDRGGWLVERPGAVKEAELTRLSGTIVLFVCTGNTCRSPMAEALFKARLADRIGCAIGELESRGYSVLSAGMGAMDGMPATAHAVEIVRGRGGSLATHASRRVTRELVAHADFILAMTAEHRDALLDEFPDAEPRTRLLDPSGDDVDDPIGADRDTYRQTAESIERHVRPLLDEVMGRS